MDETILLANGTIPVNHEQQNLIPWDMDSINGGEIRSS
jgi:hypothetical protein